MGEAEFWVCLEGESMDDGGGDYGAVRLYKHKAVRSISTEVQKQNQELPGPISSARSPYHAK